MNLLKRICYVFKFELQFRKRYLGQLILLCFFMHKRMNVQGIERVTSKSVWHTLCYAIHTLLQVTLTNTL